MVWIGRFSISKKTAANRNEGPNSGVINKPFLPTEFWPNPEKREIFIKELKEKGVVSKEIKLLNKDGETKWKGGGVKYTPEGPMKTEKDQEESNKRGN